MSPVPEAALDALVAAGAAPFDAPASAREIRLSTAPGSLREVGLVLRDRSDLGFSYPADLCGEDTGDGIRLWYRLWAPGPNVTALVEVLLDRASPEVASVADVWPGFDWFERECFDMFGVRFVGHPRAATPSHMRILLPEDWVGFPFRKDYVPDFGGDPLRGPQETN